MQLWYNSSTSANGLFCYAYFSRRPFWTRHNTISEGGTLTEKVKKILMGGAEKMANDARVKITLVCTECKQRNYESKKNKKNDPDRLEMNKYCKFCRKHTLHKESK